MSRIAPPEQVDKINNTYQISQFSVCSLHTILRGKGSSSFLRPTTLFFLVHSLENTAYLYDVPPALEKRQGKSDGLNKANSNLVLR